MTVGYARVKIQKIRERERRRIAGAGIERAAGNGLRDYAGSGGAAKRNPTPGPRSQIPLPACYPLPPTALAPAPESVHSHLVSSGIVMMPSWEPPVVTTDCVYVTLPTSSSGSSK